MQGSVEGKLKEAMLYEKQPNGRVRCNLCAHRCIIDDGKKGVCQVRENQGGTLYTLVYGWTIAQHIDPVEKKPLLHFYPGSTAYSIATPGCNFRCRWCMNWEISQMPRERHLIMIEKETSPEQIVAAAKRAGCRSIAYTYTEPTIFLEYAYDTARLAHDAGLANIYVTNGYMTEEMLETFQPYLDAANVDLKAFCDETYRKYVGARLQPVLDSLKTMKRLGIWLEVTTLVIPGINDDLAELKDAAKFVASELGVDTPWHISRFFPAYKMTDVPATPISTLQQTREIGLEAGLRYVYRGNVMGGEDTFCHACGRLLIRRSGCWILENHIQPDGRCPDCSTPVTGMGMKGTLNADWSGMEATQA
jgi:pyruvate formate lyase activating enzyme